MKKVFLLSLFIMLIFSIGIFAQQTITSIGTGGDWDNTGTWDNGVPSSLDDVIIATGTTVTVNVSDAVCKSLVAGNASGTATTATLNFNSGSQLTVFGLFTIGGNGSQKDGTIVMTDGGTLKCEGLAVGTSGGTWTPGTGTVELTAANTLPPTVFTTFNNLTISGATTITTSIGLSGDWTNNSTSTVLTSSTVAFNGSSPQTIGGSNSTTFNNLAINNSSGGVTLNISGTVNGFLTLTNGLLILGSSNLLLGSGAAISGITIPSATNMVVAEGSGELRKTFTGIGSFTFPVGDNTETAEYSPVTLDFTSGLSAIAGVNLVNTKHPNNSSTFDYIDRYWTVTYNAFTGFSCNVTFSYVDADIIGTEENLYCGTWSGTAWTLLLVANTTLNQLSGTVTSFSVFTGGEASALPVELSSFSASVTKTGVLLNWKTETEVNNYGFEIQRSGQTDKWEALGFVEGHGNSNSPKEYNFKDSEINSAGTYSYRLKQIDNDGVYEFSKTIEVNFNVPSNFGLSQNYPNPFNPSTTISFNLPESGKVTLKIYNIIGKEIKTLVEGYREAGIHTFNFNAEGYPSGMYLYSLSTNGFTETKKMLFMK
jgi:hypothetical protein